MTGRLPSRAWIACPLLLAGCMFFRLERDLDRISSLAVIQGNVSQTLDHYHPLVVVLQGSSSAQTVDFTVLPRPGPTSSRSPPATTVSWRSRTGTQTSPTSPSASPR